MILHYIKYKLTSFTDHDLHSPFVFNLYTELIRNPHPYYDFKDLNQLRKQLLQNETIIEITDFGAGSKIFKNNKRRIKDIAKHGISHPKYAEFLYRLVNKFNPKTVVELGTSIGLTTLYLAKACPKSKIYTIEGCPELYQFSKHLFQIHHQENIHSVLGHFDEKFKSLIQEIDTIDFLYLDGNHSYEPTIRYFQEALLKKNNESIFVFDDIHWSEEMEKAWNEIKQHPEVTLTLDLFYIGIVFFRKEQKQKEHFILKY